jgi:hypothetical protein
VQGQYSSRRNDEPSIQDSTLSCVSQIESFSVILPV